MAVYVNTFFEKRLQDLFSLADLAKKIFAAAGVEYRVVGGLAAYLYVERAAPDAGRLTRDIDIAVRRVDLENIAKAAEAFGLHYRHPAGLDMLVRPGEPVRRAVHLVFTGERVRPGDALPVPEFGAGEEIHGIKLIPLPDLVRMKLTSFRAKDEAHINDMDEAGLITPEIEAGLAPVLRERLAQARARRTP